MSIGLRIHRAMMQYAKDKTLLMITHKLENLEDFDRIFIVDQGEIKESGSYSELIQKADGFLSHLKNFGS